MSHTTANLNKKGIVIGGELKDVLGLLMSIENGTLTIELNTKFSPDSVNNNNAKWWQNVEHYSTSHSEHMKIVNMDTTHIAHCLRRDINKREPIQTRDVFSLLKDTEFRAMIMELATRIEEA